MNDAPTPSVDGALDRLVNQFSDPLSFLRELIQNSVDAGSREVEVSFSFEEDAGGRGTMIITVADWGEGMDREIIDSRLTSLFSSAKEGDLTKIGRFGIGFASVFALEPDAVCVDTARGGESWRVLFRADRSFSRIALDAPVEGTTVRVIKEVTPEEFADLRLRGLEVIRYWCKHLETEVRVNGKLINEPLDLELLVKVRVEEPGTVIVAGYTGDGSAFCGFYNSGLTLHERRDGPYSNVALKISSRSLEHTLTRDNVLNDDGYAKVMRRVEEIVEVELVDHLFELLEARVDEDLFDTDTATMQELAAWYLEGVDSAPRPVRGRRIAKTVDGEPLSVDQLSSLSRRDRLLVAETPSPLTAALAEAGKSVVRAVTLPRRLHLALCPRGRTVAHEAWCLPLLVPETERPAGWAPLARAALELLRSSGLRVKALHLGHLAYEGSGCGSWPALSQRTPGALEPVEDARALGDSLLARRRHLVVNADHVTVQRLLVIATVEPELAAYVLVKMFLLGGRLDPDLDAVLGTRSMERRWARRTV